MEFASAVCRSDGLFGISLLNRVQHTKKINASMKIGGGGYGSVYKRVLGNKYVAIKRFYEFGSPPITGVRGAKHPNIINLLGMEYNETHALVYEFMPYGNLDDHLNCKNSMKSLSCGQRITIIMEICQALMHLHSLDPPIFHGNLKPENILFDANFVTKLSDFDMSWLRQDKVYRGIQMRKKNCRLIYMDPEFFVRGTMSTSSDVYSFGLIVLHILTRRSSFSAISLIKFVKNALEINRLNEILDESAGQWPIKETEELAKVAIMCCEMTGKDRPDLGGKVWNVVQQVGKIISANASFSSPTIKSLSSNRPERKMID